ncbi:CLOCK-interacting pacemaker a [Salarias fasciatus]|uniref:CLOCK-interacting pacemaker a n=1 Tax=Salarias fasciatus TaxID=181472 RepID=UPI001176E71D|nr:CLOCK-interacting pacemaker [Salarias fasciatus]
MSRFNHPGQHRTQFSRSAHLMSKQELERDSGFSDASSEYLSAVDLTDSEDAGRTGSTIGQDPSGQQVAVMGGSYAGLSPMIIMNNFVLKQPPNVVPADKQWGFPSPLEVMPQSQVVLLQPMASSGNSSSLKSGSENLRQSKSYVPIRKSYPKIAPHPVDTPTKRPGSSRARTSSSRRHHHGHRPYSPPSPAPPPQTTAKAVSCFEATAAQAQGGEGAVQLGDKSLYESTYTDEFRTVTDGNRMLAGKEQDSVSLHSNKQKRFSNTYNILSQSGLLGITMRTKQLIKENKRTQSLLQQLQEQTALLLKALSSGDPQLWTELQLSLQDGEKEPWGGKGQSVPV